MRSLSVLYTTTNITMLLLQEDVMFRYFVQDISVITSVLEEPFIDDGMVTTCVYSGVMSSNCIHMSCVCLCVYVCPCETLRFSVLIFVCVCVCPYTFVWLCVCLCVCLLNICLSICSYVFDGCLSVFVCP